MRKAQYFLSLMIAAAVTAAGADDTSARLGKAATVLNTMTQSGHDIRAGELAGADCIVVIPGFKKGAVVVGVGHGRGFISCRNGDGWSAPGAIALDQQQFRRAARRRRNEHRDSIDGQRPAFQAAL